MHVTAASTAQLWEVLSSAMVINHVAPFGMRGRRIVREFPPASGFGLASDQDERASIRITGRTVCGHPVPRAGPFLPYISGMISDRII